jgi:U32 family peptidase
VIHILSPVINGSETARVIEAGADEIYCGIMPAAWKKTYSNIASPNRREWAAANMSTPDDLKSVVDAAHARKVPVFMTLNALYTEEQYPALESLIRDAGECGVDALIIADFGILLKVRDMGWKGLVHVSTGGTSFNHETIAFYKSLGASRVIIPRHNRVTEIAALAAAHPDIELETFVMNSGCMNIDGFCTHHHGTRELKQPFWWNIPKKLHADHYVLRTLKRLPPWLRTRLSRRISRKADSACLLNYDVDVQSAGGSAEGCEALRSNLHRGFGVFTGFDTCGACALWDFARAGIASLKIVGRNNPLDKKLNDVRFLATCRAFLSDASLTRERYAELTRETYRKVYGFDCGQWCYFPAEDLDVPASAL